MSLPLRNDISIRMVFTSSWQAYRENFGVIFVFVLFAITMIELMHDLQSMPQSSSAEVVAMSPGDFIFSFFMQWPLKLAFYTIGGLAVTHIAVASFNGVNLATREVMTKLYPNFVSALLASVISHFAIAFGLAYFTIFGLGMYALFFFIFERIVCNQSSAIDSLRSSSRFVLRTIRCSRCRRVMSLIMILYYLILTNEYFDSLRESNPMIYALSVILRNLVLAYLSIASTRFFLLSQSCEFRR